MTTVYKPFGRRLTPPTPHKLTGAQLALMLLAVGGLSFVLFYWAFKIGWHQQAGDFCTLHVTHGGALHCTQGER